MLKKTVAVVRQKSPEPAVLLDDGLQVSRCAGAIEHAPLAYVDERVFLPVHLEVVHRRIANDDWRVHHRVVIRCPIAVFAAVHWRQSRD
jgi:hypothetical protein